MAGRSSRVAALDRLIARPFAHRGLHGPGRIENSRAAFAAAVAAGHGIELDVQAARDGTAFVIHDATLERLTEAEGTLAELGPDELRSIPLRGSEETVPPLPEILELIGSTPVLIEVKAQDRAVVPLCRSIFQAVDGHGGPFAIMSFNPEVGRWFGRHAPHVLRGLVVTEGRSRALRGRIERQFALWRALPDFLAYDIRDLPSPFAARQRARGLPVLTWTVRSDADRARAALHADQIIYEIPPGS